MNIKYKYIIDWYLDRLFLMTCTRDPNSGESELKELKEDQVKDHSSGTVAPQVDKERT